MLRSRRVRALTAATIAVSAGVYLALSNVAAQAYGETTKLDQMYMSNYNSLMAKSYCEKHGIGDNAGQCSLITWYEESRLADPPKLNKAGNTRP